jgi:hypothetical protein
VRRAKGAGSPAAPPGHREGEERHCGGAVGLRSAPFPAEYCWLPSGQGGGGGSFAARVADADANCDANGRMRLAGRISNTRLVFENEALEREFVAEMCSAHQYGMSSGLLSHSCAALWQMQTVLWPDHADYFRAHGVGEWQRSIDTLRVLLGAHAIFATLTSATLICYMWWLRPRYEAAASVSGSVEVGRGGKMNAGRRPGISLDALVAR